MSSEQYKYKRDALWRQYQEKEIDHDKYISLLTQLIKEEAKPRLVVPSEAERRLWAEENERLNLEEELKKAEHIKNLPPPQRYHEIDIPKTIKEYKLESKRYRNIHNIFQGIIIIGSILVTSTTGATIVTDTFGFIYWLKYAAAFLSILVSISAGITGYFKFRERSANLQEAADDIEQDYKSLELGIGIYKGKSKEDASTIFAERTLNRIGEQKKRQQQLEQPPDTKHGQIQD